MVVEQIKETKRGGTKRDEGLRKTLYCVSEKDQRERERDAMTWEKSKIAFCPRTRAYYTQVPFKKIYPLGTQV